MRLTVLGSGSAMPVPDRAQSGYLLDCGDRSLLVDCGSGVLGRLAGTDTGYEGVSTVLLTHHHLDHVAALLPLVKARWLAGEEHLEVVGPTGTKALVDGLLDVHDYWMADRPRAPRGACRPAVHRGWIQRCRPRDPSLDAGSRLPGLAAGSGGRPGERPADAVGRLRGVRGARGVRGRQRRARSRLLVSRRRRRLEPSDADVARRVAVGRRRRDGGVVTPVSTHRRTGGRDARKRSGRRLRRRRPGGSDGLRIRIGSDTSG
jgi:Metal-dependent hydrolases of the beta-lactamase superfamily III